VPEEIRRGQIWWADLPEPRRSEPGYRRPVLVIQAESFNQSRIQTVVVAMFTSNLARANSPGNVLIPNLVSGLTHDSVVNVSQIMTLDRAELTELAGNLSQRWMTEIDTGLRLAMQL